MKTISVASSILLLILSVVVWYCYHVVHTHPLTPAALRASPIDQFFFNVFFVGTAALYQSAAVLILFRRYTGKELFAFFALSVLLFGTLAVSSILYHVWLKSPW